MSYKILPVPFAESLYGTKSKNIYQQILSVKGSNDNYSHYFPTNLIDQNCKILEPLQYQSLPDDELKKGSYFKSCLSMATSLQQKIVSEIDFENDKLCLIGGDHSISIGTGAGLSKLTNLSKIGLIWIDAHGDFNTPETSVSKSITGYPCAINNGLGLSEFTDLYQGNFIQKTVQIGLRDVDELEHQNLLQKNIKTYSALDIEDLGISAIMHQTLEYLQDCDYLWLSVDIDSLDSIYFEPGETDEPTFAGMTPRELMFITQKTEQTGKLKIFEIVQLNNLEKRTNLVVLANRLIETSFGLGKYRYNNS